MELLGQLLFPGFFGAIALTIVLNLARGKARAGAAAPSREGAELGVVAASPVAWMDAEASAATPEQPGVTALSLMQQAPYAGPADFNAPGMNIYGQPYNGFH